MHNEGLVYCPNHPEEMARGLGFPPGSALRQLIVCATSTSRPPLPSRPGMNVMMCPSGSSPRGAPLSQLDGQRNERPCPLVVDKALKGRPVLQRIPSPEM